MPEAICWLLWWNWLLAVLHLQDFARGQWLFMLPAKLYVPACIEHFLKHFEFAKLLQWPVLFLYALKINCIMCSMSAETWTRNFIFKICRCWLNLIFQLLLALNLEMGESGASRVKRVDRRSYRTLNTKTYWKNQSVLIKFWTLVGSLLYNQHRHNGWLQRTDPVYLLYWEFQ